MNDSGPRILMIFLLLIILLIAYWFTKNFIWIEEENEVGLQGVAQSNQLLASEFFLRKMGVQVQQVNGLLAFRKLPSTQHTIVIATQRETLNKELSQKLLQWVTSGGHLIVEARYLSAKKLQDIKQSQKKKQNKKVTIDDLLEDFDVYALDSKLDSKSKDIPLSVVLEQLKDRKEIQVNFPYQKVLSEPGKLIISERPVQIDPVWQVNDEFGRYLVQFAHGQGILTVLTSTSMFNNEHIAHNDHAQFLFSLVQQSGNNTGVWLIRVDDMPALWVWLWKNAWYSMLSISLLFLIWLWRAPLRFGPRLNDDPVERRSLIEHIQASAYYRWHNNQSGYLLVKRQEQLWKKIHISHPAIRRENLSQAYSLLEKITGIEETVIKQAFTPVEKINEHEFTRLIQLLETIRCRL